MSSLQDGRPKGLIPDIRKTNNNDRGMIMIKILKFDGQMNGKMSDCVSVGKLNYSNYRILFGDEDTRLCRC